MKTQKKLNFQWDSPAHWLIEKCQQWNEEELRGNLVNLVHMVDSDELQDAYQLDMVADGYFDAV